MTEKILEVKELRTYFKKGKGYVKSVDGVIFDVYKGEVLGIVGESGCGKSVTSLSVMQLLPEPYGEVAGGSIWFEGENLLEKTKEEMCDIRGNKISMIFQEPMTSLNPVFKCGDQIAESIREHQKVDKRQAFQQAVKLLSLVGIPEPEKRAEEFPHQLSGGMRQRVMIAMALACTPKLLIADEPTTALDVTIQAQILDLLRKIQKEFDMSTILITHDLGVVSEMADRVLVMYSGKIVEEATVKDIFKSPFHPYTEGLLRSIPKLEEEVERLEIIDGVVPDPQHRPAGCCFAPRCHYATEICRREEPQMVPVGEGHRVACHNATKWKAEVEKKARVYSDGNKEKEHKKEVLLDVQGLKTYFPIKKGFLTHAKVYVKAVDDISFKINKGEVLGLVGESGCGKTTLGKTILRLVDATEGKCLFEGKDILQMTGSEMKKLRKDIQVIFQDPYASLNPRMTVEQIIAEPLKVHRLLPEDQIKDRVKLLMEKVGLAEYQMKRYPHEFSGGQRQRVGIARALAVNPKLIICDEPVSALDVSIQSQILNLLKDLQEEFDLSYLFIAHGLAAVKHVSDRVGVMYLGKMVELTESEELYRKPLHPYTQALLSAIPEAGISEKKERIILEGDVPSPVNPPKGCRFCTRCRFAQERCKVEDPPFKEVEKGHWVACHLFK